MAPMTDEEIDSLIREVYLSASPESPDGDQPNGSLSAFWYLAVFLLGMTVMEGLRVMIPPLQEVRGEMHHRCSGHETPNPADPGTVAWIPE